MKKSALVVLFMAFSSIAIMAQNVQEGLNHLYAQRYESAKSSFEKLIAGNPNNLEASYWLGQTLIAQQNIAAAKSLYDKTLASSNNAPLIVAALGHIALVENKIPEARQQFETAINASKGRKGNDPNVLNAVGRAISETYTENNKRGDLEYAIAKLTEASQIAPTNGDILINLGNAYRKKRDAASGGLAVQAFRKAATIPSTAAVGNYRVARLYQTQVRLTRPDDWGIVLENLNNAIAADARFAPAYDVLYDYYLQGKRDFSKAEEIVNKYKSSADPSPNNTYMEAQLKFVQGQFNEAIALGKTIISATNNNPKPRVYRLLGYSYMAIKDTSTACDNVNQFFTKATEEDVIGQDYILHAQACGRNNPELMRDDITKAIRMDSVFSRQQDLLLTEIANARKVGQRELAGEMSLLLYQLQGEKANPASTVNIGTDFYYSGKFQKADSLFQLYSKAFPDSLYGHLWSARARVQMDTAMKLGLAVPSYEQLLRVAETNKLRDTYKSAGISAAQYLAAYHINEKSDKATARTYVDRGLAIDPTNATLQSYDKFLKGSPNRQAATQNTTNGDAKDTKSQANKTPATKPKPKPKGK